MSSEDLLYKDTGRKKSVSIIHRILNNKAVHNLASAKQESHAAAASETQTAPFGLIFNRFSFVANNLQRKGARQ